MTLVEWKKFGRGMLMLIVLAICIGAAIGSCRGTATVVQRFMEDAK